MVAFRRLAFLLLIVIAVAWPLVFRGQTGTTPAIEWRA